MDDACDHAELCALGEGAIQARLHVEKASAVSKRADANAPFLRISASCENNLLRLSGADPSSTVFVCYHFE